MHGMLKSAAASAIPALLGLAVFPASAMAAPHSGRAAARATKAASRMVHTTGTAHTHRLNSTGAEFAATPATPAILMFIAVPVHPDGTAQLARFYRVGSPIGGAATGIIGSKGDKITGNRVTALGGTGLDNSTGGSTGFSEVVDGATISGISLGRGQGNAIAGKRG